MTALELREQYGTTVIMGVDKSVVDGLQKDGFTCRRDAIRIDGGQVYPLVHEIQNRMRPMLRCEAECSSAFKQVIPYVILEHRPSGRIFMTMRLGGDSRLIGQASIGLGGHIDDGEDVRKCIYRELNEEVGIVREDIVDITFCGFLYTEESEVDSVHVGMVYRAYTKREGIACIEKDKLSGAWISLSDLNQMRMDGRLESWSAIAFDHVLRKEDA